MLVVLLVLLLPPPSAASTVQVYSEFRRVDRLGQFIEQDRAGQAREILSPAMARNAFHSLRIVLHVERGKKYALHIGQNPENGLKFQLYRELAQPGSAIRDRIEPVSHPVTGTGVGAESYWLDVWVPPQAVVERVRIEAQLHDGDGWTVYPMEARVLAAILPTVRPRRPPLPPAEMSSDAVARQVLQQYICGETAHSPPPPRSVLSLIQRNALQDVALARWLQLRWGKEKLSAAIVAAAGGGEIGAWCAKPPASSPYGPEWYLKVRDFLYREASR
jgi:hypothetical protein